MKRYIENNQAVETTGKIFSYSVFFILRAFAPRQLLLRCPTYRHPWLSSREAFLFFCSGCIRASSEAVFLSLALFVALLLQSCDSHDKNVLATVNGSPVTRAELDVMIGRMFGEHGTTHITPEIEQKALESLVMARAIAGRERNQADAETLAAIDAKTARYREELLVEAYLKAHAGAYVPSEHDINAYYKAHPGLFGSETVYSYELLASAAKPAPERLPAVLKVLTDAGKQADWRRLAAANKELIWLQKRSDKPAADDRLTGVLKQLAAGDVSDIVYLAGKPQRLRLLEVETTPPKPLDDVRVAINRSLAARHLQHGIREIADEILKDTDVVYLNNVSGKSDE